MCKYYSNSRSVLIVGEGHYLYIDLDQVMQLKKPKPGELDLSRV